MIGILKKTIEGIYNIAVGMLTVLKHIGRKPITSSYPDVVPELYPMSRHRLALTVNPDTAEHLCIACKQCERICPDTCITVIGDPEKKGVIKDFYLDHGLCMFCGLCVEVCPTNCIINTVDFEMSEYSREDLIYDIDRLTLTQDQSRFYFDFKEMPKPKPKPKPVKTPVPAAATPSVSTATQEKKE